MQIEIDELAAQATLIGDFEGESEIFDELKEAFGTEALIELVVEDVPFRANVADVTPSERDGESTSWTARLVNVRRETDE